MNIQKLRNGDILIFNKDIKGICIAKKKYTVKILTIVKDVRVIYNFFHNQIDIVDIKHNFRNKKSYYMINKKNIVIK